MVGGQVSAAAVRSAPTLEDRTDPRGARRGLAVARTPLGGGPDAPGSEALPVTARCRLPESTRVAWPPGKLASGRGGVSGGAISSGGRRPSGSALPGRRDALPGGTRGSGRLETRSGEGRHSPKKRCSIHRDREFCGAIPQGRGQVYDADLGPGGEPRLAPSGSGQGVAAALSGPARRSAPAKRSCPPACAKRSGRADGSGTRGWSDRQSPTAPLRFPAWHHWTRWPVNA
jgi:hypothetical protein